MLMRTRTSVVSIAALLCFVVGSLGAEVEEADKPLSYSGKVIHVQLEGGFYGIIADDGSKYDPINLKKEFQEDGLRVTIVARPKPGMGGFHMWGSYIEIISIEKEESTLKETTQCHGRSDIMPLARQYRMDRMFETKIMR